MASNVFSNKVNLSGPNPNNLGNGLSLGSNGSVNAPTGLGFKAPTNAFSTALNNVASGKTSGNNTYTIGGSNSIQPSTPLKSVTTNNIDGSSTTHEFHKPDTGTDTGLIKKDSTDSNKTTDSTQTPSVQPTSTYASAVQNAQQAGNNSANFNAGLMNEINAIKSNRNYVSPIAEGLAGQVQQTGGIQGQRLADIATNATNIASKLAPVTQFGVLTDPTTGQPISGGSAGAAAFQGGQIQGQQTAGSNYASQRIAHVAASGIKDTIKSQLLDPSLNPSEIRAGNLVSQWLSTGLVSDPKYKNLFNSINEYISTLAPILGVGGDTTNLKTEIAQSFIDSSASASSISQVLDGIDKLATDKLANIASAGQGGGQVAGGTPASAGLFNW